MADESEFSRVVEELDESLLGSWAASLNTTSAQLRVAIGRDQRLLEQLRELLGTPAPARSQKTDPPQQRES